jgi:hypothetical protein
MNTFQPPRRFPDPRLREKNGQKSNQGVRGHCRDDKRSGNRDETENKPDRSGSCAQREPPNGNRRGPKSLKRFPNIANRPSESVVHHLLPSELITLPA